MIVQQQKEIIVESVGEENESITMSLDMESTQMLMQMLSKNLYSDEIGSTVRETASNALDSHRRAKVDRPIIVSLKINPQYTFEYCVEDFGIGLDADDVRNIISKYGKSLARDEANALGMMGLGFKAPLAYTSAFYFIARKNGVERKYMMYEGESGNMIDLLYEQPTKEGSGVKIIIPLKSGDKYDFIKKIKEQLAYFEGVYFDVPELDNGFKILRTNDFQRSDLSMDGSLHICLDNVYYPLDFNKMGIPRITLPLGLRFGLSDGIFPTPNREALRYTPIAKTKILEKIKTISDYLVKKFNETIVTDSTLDDIFKYYGNKSRCVDIGGRVYDITDLIQYSSVSIETPKLKGLTLISTQRIFDMRNYLLNEYRVKYRLHNGKMSAYKENDESVDMKDLSPIYIFADRISGNKREYMKHLLGWGTRARFVKKIMSYKLRDKKFTNFTTYYELLGLHNIPKWKWRQAIKEFQYVQSLMTSKFIDLDKIDIPKSWLDNRKVKTASKTGRGKYVKLQGEAVGKLACDLEKSMYNQNCKFVPETIKLQELHKFPGITVYTNHDDAKKLDPLYHICRRTENKLRFVTFSDREMKNLAKIELHNLMTYEKFMEGKTAPFKRIITAYLINQLMTEQRNVFGKMDHLKSISMKMYNDLKTLQEYKNKYYVNSYDEVYKSMLAVAQAHNLFDPIMYGIYLNMKKDLEYLKFLNPILNTISGSYSSYNTMKEAEVNFILCDLFKYYKFRIDYQNYKAVVKQVPAEIPIPEEEKEETEITAQADVAKEGELVEEEQELEI